MANAVQDRDIQELKERIRVLEGQVRALVQAVVVQSNALAIQTGGTLNLTAGGATSVTVGAAANLAIGAAASLSVGTDARLDVGRGLSITSGKTATLTTTQLVIQVGGSSISLKPDGTVELSGRWIELKSSGNMTLKAGGHMILKASSIKQN